MSNNVISGTAEYFAKNDYLIRADTFDGKKLTYVNDRPEVTSITDSYKSSLDELYERIMSELTYKPVVEHKCNNCGAPLQMDADNHLFKCKYCGTVYLIGTGQIYG